VFTIRLPVTSGIAVPGAAPESPAAEPQATIGVSMAAPDLNGLRVLLVDDDRDTLEVVSTMLSQFGADVRAAASSSSALEVFLAWQPDVLVSDVGMPDEDGYDLIGKIRALPPEQGRNTPAAALTAHVADRDRDRALTAGYHIHIKKPVDPFTLGTTVARLGKQTKRP
jgi:CheY-like chemotaxis protein